MTTAHPLDRPVWNALSTRQAHLAVGDARALRFAFDYGLFAAAADASPDSLAALAALVPVEGRIATLDRDVAPAMPGVVSEPFDGVQMVAERPATEPPAFDWEPLTEADAPQMLALARLTEPGPFFVHTNRLGNFVGVKQAGRLVAMAGERLQPPGFTEISGVCTHPDHRGHGLASGLMRLVAAGVVGRGETPFLHTYAHHTRTIALYETLGFVRRGPMAMTMLSRG